MAFYQHQRTKRHFNGCTNELIEIRETEAQSGGEGLCEDITQQYSLKFLKTLVGGSQSIHKDPHKEFWDVVTSAKKIKL